LSDQLAAFKLKLKSLDCC